MKLEVILLCCIILIKDVYVQKEEGDSCIDNGNKNGTCKPTEKCTSALENLKRQIFPKICGFKGIIALVCCVETSEKKEEIKLDARDGANTLSNSTRIIGEISKSKCEEYADYSYRKLMSPLLTIKPRYEKIYDCHLKSEILTVGSFETAIEQFPHMAHFGYDYENGIQYVCPGTLISNNFVLTAAHCVEGSFYNPSPVLVRFGVTNLDANHHRQEIKVAEIYRHPQYIRTPNIYHDIALVKLEKPVEINKYVRPACLNTITEINYKTAVVSGWGLKSYEGEDTKNLVRSLVNFMDNEKCMDWYKKIQISIRKDSMICAAVTSSQRKDTQAGVSGSPLQVQIEHSKELQCMSLIIGVLSYGFKHGDVGIPSVYTRVSNYIDWIEQIVWPLDM